MSPIGMKLKPATLAMALAAAFPVIGYAAAGRIDFAVGEVKIVAADGRARAAGKGDEFSSGETIETGNGRAWLRFTDGAQVSLQPQSQYRIDNYNFTGKADGGEKGFFSLLKGGLRTITGLIGRTNRNNYGVNTAVATIGIRGTEYSITYGNSITVSIGEGSVEVCNSAGCLVLNSGETGYVAGAEVQPVLSGKKADLPPPPKQDPPTFSVAENTGSNGSVTILGGGTMASGPGYTLLGYRSPGTNFSAVGTATFSGNALNDVTLDASHYARATGAVLGTGDGIIGWGVWATADYDSGTGVQALTEAHYVVGIPTATAEFNTLSGTIPFTFLGATAPSSTGASVGSVSSGSLSATFSGGYTTGLSFSLLMSSGLSLSGTGSGGPGPFFGGATTCSGTGCSCGGTGTFAGSFFGSNAARAGLAYQLPISGGPTIWGAAAFTR